MNRPARRETPPLCRDFLPSLSVVQFHHCNCDVVPVVGCPPNRLPLSIHAMHSRATTASSVPGGRPYLHKNWALDRRLAQVCLICLTEKKIVTLTTRTMGFTKTVLRAGNGICPRRGQSVTVHCTGEFQSKLTRATKRDAGRQPQQKISFLTRPLCSLFRPAIALRIWKGQGPLQEVLVDEGSGTGAVHVRRRPRPGDQRCVLLSIGDAQPRARDPQSTAAWSRSNFVSYLLITGWDESVIAMSLGEVSKIHCSPDYAYGPGGFPAW